LRLHEYEAKAILTEYGVPTPKGGVAKSPQEARMIAARIGGPVALKAQVLVAGRGKAGGVVYAEGPDEAEVKAEKLLGSEIKGLKVDKLLVEEKVRIVKELYLSLTLNRGGRCFTFLYSSEGGVDVEELASKYPEKIVRLNVNPLLGLRDFEVRRLVKEAGLPGEAVSILASIVKAFYSVASRYDCELVESNPLALTSDGKLVAVDARIVIDDSALFRHPEFKGRVREELTDLERKAAEAGFSYVELDGDIGVIGNGAGLTMASMDLVYLYGGKPANFLDIGGGAREERVEEAVKLQLLNPRVKAVLVNVLGGITRCDEVAKGVVKALRSSGVVKPIVVRLVGTREEEGRRIMLEAGQSYLESMEEAAKKAVELARGMLSGDTR